MHATRVIAALVLGALIGTLFAEPILNLAYAASFQEPRLAALISMPVLVAVAAVLIVLLTYPFERAPKAALKPKP